MSSPLADTDSNTQSESSGQTQAKVAIELHPENTCMLLEGMTVDDVQQSLAPQGDGWVCRAAFSNDGERTYCTRTVDEHCIGPVFATHDCIQTIDGVEAGRLEVSLILSNRSELQSIISSLRSRGAEADLLEIRSSEPQEGETTVELDSLTDKQLEAVDVAVRFGYYDRPRGVSLGGLAEHLGISRSAVSQRLASVEEKMITSLHESEFSSSSQSSR